VSYEVRDKRILKKMGEPLLPSVERTRTKLKKRVLPDRFGSSVRGDMNRRPRPQRIREPKTGNDKLKGGGGKKYDLEAF